jgi:predicted Rossmann fold nucleotide-binding protein DprA/Smf involved in DNA uptake
LTHTLRWSVSRAERVQSLVLEKVASLLRCPPERRKDATHEALSKLRPHVEAELEALETLEWLRDLTNEELARRRAFVMFLAAIRPSEEAGVEREKPARERVLAALRYGAATNPELQELTGTKVGTVRDTLCLLVYEGEVVAEGGRPMTYRLA